MGYSPWSCIESDTTEWLTQSLTLIQTSCINISWTHSIIYTWIILSSQWYLEIQGLILNITKITAYIWKTLCPTNHIFQNYYYRKLKLWVWEKGYVMGWIGFPQNSNVTIFIDNSSAQFISSVMSNYLLPHVLKHARLPCLSPTPRACLNSRPSHRWCHSTISFSVILFSCHQSFQASGSFPMSQFFTSGGQSIGVSASASVLPMNIQDWFPLRLTGLISMQSNRLSNSSKPSVLQHSGFLMDQLSNPYVTTGKTIALTKWTFVSKLMSLLFNMLSGLVIAFLPRSTHL